MMSWFQQAMGQLGQHIVQASTGWDWDDWCVLAIVTGAWIASTVFLFKHPDDPNFATWAGLAITMTGTYKWLSDRDDQTPDAPKPQINEVNNP